MKGWTAEDRSVNNQNVAGVHAGAHKRLSQIGGVTNVFSSPWQRACNQDGAQRLDTARKPGRAALRSVRKNFPCRLSLSLAFAKKAAWKGSGFHRALEGTAREKHFNGNRAIGVARRTRRRATSGASISAGRAQRKAWDCGFGRHPVNFTPRAACPAARSSCGFPLELRGFGSWLPLYRVVQFWILVAKNGSIKNFAKILKGK